VLNHPQVGHLDIRELRTIAVAMRLDDLALGEGGGAALIDEYSGIG